MEKLEGNVQVQAVGDCFLSKLKSHLITVNTTQGSITSTSSLIGDIIFTTGNEGHITLNKLQGNNIKMNCEHGKLRIESLYGGNTVLETGSGDIHIGNAHGRVWSCSLFDCLSILCSSIHAFLITIFCLVVSWVVGAFYYHYKLKPCGKSHKTNPVASGARESAQEVHLTTLHCQSLFRTLTKNHNQSTTRKSIKQSML